MGRDHMPFQVPAMHTENGRDGLASSRHAHKSESAGFIIAVLACHIRSFNAAKHLKHLAKVASCNVPRQITYADIHSLLRSFASNTCVSRACQTKRNDSGDGVLRLTMRSIANGLASRLHQAIIPSSEFHERPSLYRTPASRQTFFLFRLRNSLHGLSHPRRENAERAKINRFLQTPRPHSGYNDSCTRDGKDSQVMDSRSHNARKHSAETRGAS